MVLTVFCATVKFVFNKGALLAFVCLHAQGTSHVSLKPNISKFMGVHTLSEMNGTNLGLRTVTMKCEFLIVMLRVSVALVARNNPRLMVCESWTV